MKLSTLAWLAFFSICIYYMTTMGQAYYAAIYALQDARNSQAMSILTGK